MEEEEDENTQGKPSINYKAICCEEIPELFLDKLVAKKHFSRFGKISRFILRPKRLSCTVEYETEEDAERAYLESGNYNGYDFLVNYAEYEVAHVQNTEEWVDPDVQSELDAMSPGNRLMSTQMMRPPPVPLTKNPPAPRMVKPAQAVPTQKTAKAAAVTTTELPRVDASVRNELEALLRRPAYTDEDKYRVLDARDKLIRLTTVRQTDIKKAVATRGTCPDMCPEKERLMREFQRQVASFEMADDNENVPNGDRSTISHRKAIKEYSRSSADQEVPLAHELRSESVLQMTMLYLMHRIMDLCDDPRTSLADWFHFVWDRTRSIRKDITQQELCSLGAVQLVEQCARFHIHCAARLAAEDPSVFDKKINAENLTKCLQTLKYMYHDLRIKGVLCPCEAEFRSYIVLLNLGDANFLWELKQLPVHIQNSREIKRAIAFYNALQNNNYVRFFAMIRDPETTYLSACILLGYFNKLRFRAMEAIIKSHNWRKNDVFLPLSYLTRVLGFEDETAAANFFSYHGLQCDDVEERVMLDRLRKPDVEYAMERALRLIESKRLVSVGECVCGEPLRAASNFELHQPHNSFDANGLLKPEAWTAEDQLRGEAAGTKAVTQQGQQEANKAAPIKPSAETSIFKMPQATPLTTSKQHLHRQQKQQQEQEQSQQKSIFGGEMPGMEEKKTPGTGGFQFGSTKSQFGSAGSGSTSNSTSSKSSGGFTFKLPASPVKITESSTPSTAGFFSSVFKPIVEQTAPLNVADNDAFGRTPSEGNIFSSAAKETANVFQNATQTEHLRQDNIFQHFEAKAEMPMFGIFQKGAASSIFETKPDQESSDRNTHAGPEQAVRELEARQQWCQQELEKERRKLQELEQQKAVERQKAEEREARERKEAEDRRTVELLEKAAAKQFQELLSDVLAKEIGKVASEELTAYHSFVSAAQELAQSLLAEVLRCEIDEIANEEYALMCHDQLLLTRYFNRWLQYMHKKRHQRKLMESTPIWVTTNTRAEYVQMLRHPSEPANLEMIKRYRHGQSCDFKQLLWPDSAADGHLVSVIDFFRIIDKHFVRKHALGPDGLLHLEKYFKLLLTLPAEKEESSGFESFCNKWLSEHVARPVNSKFFVCGLEGNVALCVHKFSGVRPVNENGSPVRREADHADGIICFLSGVNTLHQTRRRLHNLVKLMYNRKRVPLAIIAYNCSYGQDELAAALELEELVEEGSVSTYKCYGCHLSRQEFSFGKMLTSATRFVARESSVENATALEALAMQPLRQWLERCLGEEMWQRWTESSLTNPVFAKICSMPQHVLGVYHEALKRLTSMAEEDLNEMPEFPEELREFVPKSASNSIPLGLEHFPPNWKDPARQASTVKFLQKLSMPAMAEELPQDVEALELWLLNYASCCIPEDDIAATAASYSAISALIGQLNCPDMLDLELHTRLSMLNYIPIIKPIVFAYINNVQKREQKPLAAYVIFERRALRDYQTQPWWLNYEPLDLVTVDYAAREEETDGNKSQTQTECSGDDLVTIIEQAEQASRKAEETLIAIQQRSVLKSNPKQIGECLELRHSLDESLHQFDLAKQIGDYNTSFVREITEEIDAAFADTMAEGRGAPGHKRKRIDESGTKDSNEVNDAIARALSIIEEIECIQDRRERARKSLKLCSGSDCTI